VARLTVEDGEIISVRKIPATPKLYQLHSLPEKRTFVRGH